MIFKRSKCYFKTDSKISLLWILSIKFFNVFCCKLINLGKSKNLNKPLPSKKCEWSQCYCFSIPAMQPTAVVEEHLWPASFTLIYMVQQLVSHPDPRKGPVTNTYLNKIWAVWPIDTSFLGWVFKRHHDFYLGALSDYLKSPRERLSGHTKVACQQYQEWSLGQIL